MHAMNTGSSMIRLLLLGMLAWGALTIGEPGPVRAGASPWHNDHGLRVRKTVRARLGVAGTDMSDLVGGRSLGNLWGSLRTGSSFSVSTVRDLYLYVYWTNLSGEHLMTLLIYGPDGQLYQRRVVPIATDGQSSSTRQVPGIEGVVDVQPTRPYGKYDVSTLQLPIAGTWITRHRLLGTWRVDLLLDDASSPLVSGTFSLRE